MQSPWGEYAMNVLGRVHIIRDSEKDEEGSVREFTDCALSNLKLLCTVSKRVTELSQSPENSCTSQLRLGINSAYRQRDTLSRRNEFCHIIDLHFQEGS